MMYEIDEKNEHGVKRFHLSRLKMGEKLVADLIKIDNCKNVYDWFGLLIEETKSYLSENVRFSIFDLNQFDRLKDSTYKEMANTYITVRNAFYEMLHFDDPTSSYHIALMYGLLMATTNDTNETFSDADITYGLYPRPVKVSDIFLGVADMYLQHPDTYEYLKNNGLGVSHIEDCILMQFIMFGRFAVCI